MVLFNGMQKTSHWAALYFVALMTFGNYVLFNLLVAILVEGFSSEVSSTIANTVRRMFESISVHSTASTRTSIREPSVNDGSFSLVFAEEREEGTRAEGNGAARGEGSGNGERRWFLQDIQIALDHGQRHLHPGDSTRVLERYRYIIKQPASQ